MRLGLGFRRLLTGFAALTTLALAGCLDVEQDVSFMPDGTATVTARLAVDKEMEDVYTAVEALAKLSTDPKLAPYAQGVCSPASVAAARPGKPPVDARRYIAGNRSVCEVRKSAVELSPDKVDPLGLGIMTMTRTGPREMDIVLDLSRVPDITPMLMLALLGELQKRPEFERGVPDADMTALTDKLKKGMTALTAVAMRNRYVQVTFEAPRILAAEGAATNDGKRARFRLSYAELAELALDPAARRGKRYRVTVAY